MNIPWLGKQCLTLGKNTLFTKIRSTIIAIDALHMVCLVERNLTFQICRIHSCSVPKFKPTYLIGHSLGAKTCLYYQSVYQNNDLQKMVVLGSPSDFNIILNNYIALSLNSIVRGLEIHYLKNFNLKLEQFFRKSYTPLIKQKVL
jgi:triacylglycerol esterase/lipase EstA (alpha/beta hydrolase family)